MARANRGCLPWVLGAVLVGLWLAGADQGLKGGLDVQVYDPRSPRRPLPTDETFVIEDPGPPRDSQGTAFAIDRDGVWLTAEHVTHGCDRLGLADNGYIAEISRVLESRESDAALLIGGPAAPRALSVAVDPPRPGAVGYHMGFPAGVPTVVVSRFLGAAQALRGPSSGRQQPIYAWAEDYRVPAADGPLGGISGGPTLDSRARVVGVNSASTPRRGRVLTTDPAAVARLVTASRSVDEPPVEALLDGDRDAVRLFTALRVGGVVREVYCDVL